MEDAGTPPPAPPARPFLLFSKRSAVRKAPCNPTQPLPSPALPPEPAQPTSAAPREDPSGDATFADLGLSRWAAATCKALNMKRPTAVQRHCIPRILAGEDVLGLAETGSGKTAAFALPILHRLAEERYGVFALVVTPTRELAYQLATQFRALGSSLEVRCAVVVGGMNMLNQAKALMQRPHIVIATPGRIKLLLNEDPDIPRLFSNIKFLVLDEADRILDVGFEEELRVIFQCVPKKRQTLLFSATMTKNLQALHELSANRSYFYEAYEGFRTVDTLKQQYLYLDERVKDVYLYYILSKMNEMAIRSAMIFVSTCRTCHLLDLLLKELDSSAVALHSHKSQSLRLAALKRFKSSRVPVLVATDVASRGLDIPTVDLVINYDIPRYPRDYVHRVGRTARAGRGGLSISFLTPNDTDVINEVEAIIGKKLDAFECKESDVIENISKVYKARRIARMNMLDDGFDEKVKTRKKQKLKALTEKGLLKKRKRRKASSLKVTTHILNEVAE
uniref:DEAD-box ATP-dependent RNA helicase 36 n=1 Tax=Anthurium amnicola TaxID=1678845 RepID=A0A1D1XNB5_9ARAE